MSFRRDGLDARLLGLAAEAGLPRAYFDAREYLRARVKTVDTTEIRAKNAIFVHVPKCAGSSIAQQAKIAVWHFSASFMRWHDPALWDRAFTFGFVRDPFDRLVSAFHYLRTATGHPRDVAWGAANLREFADFQAFARALDSRATRARLMGWVHFLPLTYYLCDRHGRVLVDFVGRTETFDADVAAINARSGLGLETRHANRSARPDDRPPYDAASARLVADLYAADFATFGYSPDRFG